MTAHITPHYNRYGKNGYDVIAVGFETFFARTIKIAKEWCDSHGFEYTRI